MKSTLLVFAAGALAASVTLSSLAAPAADSQEKVLINFADIRRDPDGTLFRPYEYAYDDWDNRKVIDLAGRGVLVQAPSGRGGLGENRTMVRFHQTTAVALTYLIGNDNQATSLTFAVSDGDGTERQWNIPLEGRPRGQPLRHRIDLAQPDGEPKPGRKPGLDLKKIYTWQVRGNYTGPKVEVLLIKLTTAP